MNIKSEIISNSLKEARENIDRLVSQREKILQATNLIYNAVSKENKVLLCGNGGSAADCQHIAAELVGRFKIERPGLAAIALTTDTSIITALANDYDYERIFGRQVEALGRKGDVLIAISTSGNSKNIIYAIECAKKRDMKIIILSGNDGGNIRNLGDVTLIVSSNDTAHIQEAHMVMYHIICQLIDEEFKK